jgi:hypothetical protein
VKRRTVQLADVPSVPARLRVFDPREWPGGELTGHDEWRAARRVWEADHGVTLAQVWERTYQAGAATGTLEGLNEAFTAALFIDGEDPDPRGWFA